MGYFKHKFFTETDLFNSNSLKKYNLILDVFSFFYNFILTFFI